MVDQGNPDNTGDKPSTTPAAGWYDDPKGEAGGKRYWDGQKWTNHVSSSDNPYAGPTGAGGHPAVTPLNASGQKNPWYKRPLPLVGVGFLVLIVIAAAAGGGDTSSTSSSSDSSSDTTASDNSAGSSEDGGSSDGPPTVSVGEPVDLEGTRYEVTSVDTASRLGDEYFGEDANGEFVVVEVELTNLKDETRTITSNAITLRTAKGNTYEASTDAIVALDDAIFLEEIQPDLPEKGSLAFDVPPNQVSGSVLRVEDLFSDAYAEIDLGL